MKYFSLPQEKSCFKTPYRIGNDTTLIETRMESGSLTCSDLCYMAQQNPKVRHLLLSTDDHRQGPENLESGRPLTAKGHYRLGLLTPATISCFHPFWSILTRVWCFTYSVLLGAYLNVF